MSTTKRYGQSVKEFAQDLGVSHMTIYAEINAGKLTARKIGRRTIITADDAAAYLAALPVFVARQQPSKPGARAV